MAALTSPSRRWVSRPSAGVASRPTGAWKCSSITLRPTCAWKAGSIGVAVGAGLRQFMRTLRAASSPARRFV